MNSNGMFTNDSAFIMTTINPKRTYLFGKRLFSLHAFGYSSNMSSCLLFAAATRVSRLLVTFQPPVFTSNIPESEIPFKMIMAQN